MGHSQDHIGQGGVFDELEKINQPVNRIGCLIKFIDHKKVARNETQTNAPAGQVAQRIHQDREQARRINGQNLEKQTLTSIRIHRALKKAHLLCSLTNQKLENHHLQHQR